MYQDQSYTLFVKLLVLATFKDLPAERVTSNSQSRYIANILSLDTVKNSLRLQKAFRSYVITERLVEDFLLDIVFYGVSRSSRK